MWNDRVYATSLDKISAPKLDIQLQILNDSIYLHSWGDEWAHKKIIAVILHQCKWSI